MDLCFSVLKLETFSSNPGKFHFEGSVHLLRYIRYKHNLALRCYAKIEDETLSEILRQYIIKKENQMMVFSYSSWQYFPDTEIITGAYILFYQGGPIDHCTHVPGTVSQ